MLLVKMLVRKQETRTDKGYSIKRKLNAVFFMTVHYLSLNVISAFKIKGLTAFYKLSFFPSLSVKYPFLPLFFSRVYVKMYVRFYVSKRSKIKAFRVRPAAVCFFLLARYTDHDRKTHSRAVQKQRYRYVLKGFQIRPLSAHGEYNRRNLFVA